jgi:acetoin:2,6-dichlorophenolindophenol oxidoreductase subunit beta
MAEISISRAINQALDLALASDPSVIILGEDVADPAGGALKLTRGLSTKHGTARVRDTPISETAIVGAAIGAALDGLRPVAEIMFMDFLMVCMDQLANHAAKLRYMSGGRTGVPLTIRTVVAAGRSFGAQHSQSLEGWLMHMPGINVVCPSTPADAKGLLTACIEDDDPCVFMETLALLGVRGDVPDGHYTVPLGSAAIRRPGSDVTVIAWGLTVGAALAAADELASEGVEAEVLDLRSLAPLDRGSILASVGRTRRAVVAHAAVGVAGPGAEIAAMITEELWGTLDRPVARLGAAPAPVPFAPELEALYYPTAMSIAAAARSLCA